LRTVAVRYVSVGAGFRGPCDPRTGADRLTDGAEKATDGAGGSGYADRPTRLLACGPGAWTAPARFHRPGSVTCPPGVLIVLPGSGTAYGWPCPAPRSGLARRAGCLEDDGGDLRGMRDQRDVR
jgi:hypothetical protein